MRPEGNDDGRWQKKAKVKFRVKVTAAVRSPTHDRVRFDDKLQQHQQQQQRTTTIIASLAPQQLTVADDW